jgi:hypothetical protein
MDKDLLFLIIVYFTLSRISNVDRLDLYCLPGDINYPYVRNTLSFIIR